MSSNTPFKICIILSVFTHLAVICPWPFLRLMSKPEIPFKKIELTYFLEGPVKDVIIKDIKPVTSVREERIKNIKTATRKKADNDLSEALELKIKKNKGASEEITSETSGNFENKKTVATKNNSEDTGIRENYYLKVREKIKSILEKNCRGRMEEGEVYVKFIITKNGTLKDLVLYKNSLKNARFLEAMAIKSIRQASPFPPFDDGINETELLFKQPIQITHHP